MKFEDGVSILIPSWNNFTFLKNCISSILKNSFFDHEIIVHLNCFEERAVSFLKEKNIKFSLSSQNVGVCKSLNMAYKLSTKNIIGYFNDDMWALPDWDKELNEFSQQNNCDETWVLASTMIEPSGANPCCVAPFNFGNSIEDFKEEQLVAFGEKQKKIRHNVIGTTWPPNFMSRKLWDSVGGYSEEYGIGFGSDPDLIAKAYTLGCRNFIGVGKSLVYHFQCKTTGKIKSTQHEAEQIFKNKFGISMNDFIFNKLRRGARY